MGRGEGTRNRRNETIVEWYMSNFQTGLEAEEVYDIHSWR